MIFPFNEVSLSSLSHHSDIERFYIQIEEVVRLLELEKLPNIIFKSDFVSLNINEIGNIHEIINKSNLKEDQEIALLSIIQNTPYIDEEAIEPYQITYNDVDAHGLSYAYRKDLASISIPCSNWCNFSVSANKISISDDDEIEEESIVIKHLGDLSAVQGSWLEPFIPETSYSNQEEFLEYIATQYPRVVISEDCKNSIKGLTATKIRKLDRSIDILNKYCISHWKVGKLRYSAIAELGLHLRPESESTLQQFGEQRVFLNEDGDTEQFSLHFDISEGERAYIKGITEDKNIFISKICNHLSTKKFRK
ncbi:conserved hypothetical protein [Vibrio crassostreae]|nr:conserved hypothetical protein [Vibrio crassostreae]CAK1816188.1 conserved hypothetical protein [Vibrio crassostreae]CAK2428188.1 conserved hypothetical protein [Vibrio crassostreae]CAK2702434.1 conserved hypothetical protein [Vibrio crassostreae]CAK2755816.1 conserved hypothetical protein [Vibrio crassostreae]